MSTRAVLANDRWRLRNVDGEMERPWSAEKEAGNGRMLASCTPGSLFQSWNLLVPVARTHRNLFPGPLPDPPILVSRFSREI
jgi:hypothetical protein